MINKELPFQVDNTEHEVTQIQFVFRNILRFSVRLGLVFLVLYLFCRVLTGLLCIEYCHSSFLVQFCHVIFVNKPTQKLFFFFF